MDDSAWGWKVTVDDGSGPVLVFVDAESTVNVEHFRAGEAMRFDSPLPPDLAPA